MVEKPRYKTYPKISSQSPNHESGLKVEIEVR